MLKFRTKKGKVIDSEKKYFLLKNGLWIITNKFNNSFIKDPKVFLPFKYFLQHKPNPTFVLKELSLCYKLWFSNPYIFAIQCSLYFNLWNIDQIVQVWNIKGLLSSDFKI